MKRCLRFWIDESPERCKLLWQAARELRDAYNAMLEAWETELRAPAISEKVASIEAYRDWEAADPKTRGPKPKYYRFTLNTATRKRLSDASAAAAPTIRPRLRDNMMQSEFLRDVDRYLDRRFAEHVPAGIRHRSEPMVLGLDQTKMRPEVSQNNDGAWSFRAALWAQSAPEELTNTNEDRWTLSPYDRRRETWTLDNMRDAVVLGAVLGCKIVPPRVGAPAGKRRWSLMVTVDLPDPELPAEERPYTAGVDIGIKHFAVYSCPERPTFDFISSRELQADMERVRREKRGVPRKRRQAVGAKLGRRQDTFCRLVARRLIDNCVRDRVGLLRVESLAGIREAACDDADRNFMLGARFPYFKLQTYLSQAAEKAGVAIQYIDPAGTSQTCSKCGHRDPESRKSKRFVCTKCGFQADADLNAANNIARSRKATPSRKTRGNTSPAGSIPSDAPDCTGEALEAQVVGAEVQPNALWPVGCRVEVNPFAGE